MKIRVAHAIYVAKKVTNGLFNNEHIFVDVAPLDIQNRVQEILEQEIVKEEKLEQAVEEKLDGMDESVSSEFEYMDINYRQVFWMIKRKLAKEFDFILDEEERYNHMAHQVVLHLTNEHLIDYNMSDTLAKNLVFDAILSFNGLFEEIKNAVHEKMSNYKRKIIPGTEDYDLIYSRLHEEELIRHGLA